MVGDITFQVRKDLNYNCFPLSFHILDIFSHKVHRFRVIGTFMHFYIDLHVPENDELSQTAKDRLRVPENDFCLR